MVYNPCMKAAMRQSAAWIMTIAALFATCGTSPALSAAEASYAETIAVLQTLYRNEVLAHHRYLAFADAALHEGHRNIAHMFSALADSEDVHARNFKRILLSLNSPPADVAVADIHAGSTQENLKYATDVELAEIDREYPAYIRRISPEAHEGSIRYIRYAWSAERQHRELIRDIQSGTGMFFGMLLEHFRKNTQRYFVNQNCGATVTELPEGQCPICHSSIDTYREIPRP